MKARNVLAASVAAALSIGAVKSAEAAYAFAEQDIYNFFAAPSGFTFGNFSPIYESQSSSKRHDAPAGGGSANLDAPLAFSGTKGTSPVTLVNNGGRTDGDFTKYVGEYGDYGLGDALIYRTLGDINGGAAWNIAEAYAPGESGEFEHSGTGSNAVNAIFTANGTGTLNFSWRYDVGLRTNVFPNSATGSQSNANVFFTISIFDRTAGGTLVANVAPGPQNVGISSQPDDESAAYFVIGGAGSWDANGYVFQDGIEYRINVNATEEASATQVVEKVPVPATLALMGLGLVGAGATRRIRRG